MSSPLRALLRDVLAKRGLAAAARVERAADEVPQLERLYTPDALRTTFIGDNAQALMTMRPGDFERYARPIDFDPTGWTERHVAELRKLRGGFDDVPYLEVGQKEGQIPFVSGHEGRHRSRALSDRGVESGLVRLFPHYSIREGLPRYTQEEFIDALRGVLGTPSVVTQEGKLRINKGSLNVPPSATVVLPDVYRRGGLAQAKACDCRD